MKLINQIIRASACALAIIGAISLNGAERSQKNDLLNIFRKSYERYGAYPLINIYVHDLDYIDGKKSSLAEYESVIQSLDLNHVNNVLSSVQYNRIKSKMPEQTYHRNRVIDMIQNHLKAKNYREDHKKALQGYGLNLKNLNTNSDDELGLVFDRLYLNRYWSPELIEFDV